MKKRLEMDEKIVINKEYAPERCDICHQQDMFNPSINFCQRCAGVPIAIFPNNKEEKDFLFDFIVHPRTGLAIKIFGYINMSIITLYLAWTFPIHVKDETFKHIFQAFMRIGMLLGVIYLGFDCFSNGRERTIRGFVQLFVICLMFLGVSCLIHFIEQVFY